MTARNIAELKKVAEPLQKEYRNGGQTIETHELDLTQTKHAEILASFIKDKFGKVDVLVNNAGVFLDANEGSSPETIVKTFNTNTVGPVRVLDALKPLLKASGQANVVNISSGMGQLSEMNGGYTAYRISKTALNAVTKIYAEELEPDHIKVNSVCPGWVKTDMGGAGAERSIEEGIQGIIWAATLPANGPTGGFFRDGEKLDW